MTTPTNPQIWTVTAGNRQLPVKVRRVLATGTTVVGATAISAFY